MSFSKAKLKRFNDVDVGCASPASNMLKEKNGGVGVSETILIPSSATAASTSATTTTSVLHSERREQIEKFFKDAVRFASNTKDTGKELPIVKDGIAKEDKKSKGLRLFRTPSLPQRLRFRHNTDATTVTNSAVITPLKEPSSKSISRLKGKEALQHEIRNKNDLITGYLSQIDVLQRHVEQLRDVEQKLRSDHTSAAKKAEELIRTLTEKNETNKEVNDKLIVQNTELTDHCSQLEMQLQDASQHHISEINALTDVTEQLRANISSLESSAHQQAETVTSLREQIARLEHELGAAHEKLLLNDTSAQQQYEQINNLQNTTEDLRTNVLQLQQLMDAAAEAHAQESKATQIEMDSLRNERNTLKHDLASKCELIRSLQEELLDKNCEIDAHCDTIRQLCREQALYSEKKQLVDAAEEKVRATEAQVEQKVQQIESEMDAAVEREKAYWRNEIERRQKLAENELIKIELEKQDVIVLLESTNDMLRERDEKLHKYEEQLRNGVDYYVQLTDNLQKQVVDLKQEVAKLITEKYNYQLTLNNTRSTVNILMERLKKSDADVEQFKAELESMQLAKRALEQSYLALQTDIEVQRTQLRESHEALEQLQASAQMVQQEVSVKENMFQQLLTSEQDTLDKFNKIASSFQERINMNAAATHYMELYNDMKSKDDTREVYLQDMKQALDEFATVLQFAQLEIDSKDKMLAKLHEERDQLKLENVSLKMRMDEFSVTKKENSTDLEKIEDLLIDSDIRNECDKITSWLLSTTVSPEKCVRADINQEISELLTSNNTPNNGGSALNVRVTPVRQSATKVVQNTNVTPTPRSPRSPHASAHTPKTSRTPFTTPKKNVSLLHSGKENIPSPQKQVLKMRNM